MKGGGIVMTVTDLARLLGKSRQTVYHKLQKGFTVEDLLTIARVLYGDDVKLVTDLPKKGRPRKHDRKEENK